MKRIVSAVFLLIASAVLFFGQEDKPTLAILDVVAQGVDASRGKVVYEYIMDRINRTGNYAIVERAALDKALKELEISNSQIVDEKTAIEIGKIAGAQYILVSSLIQDEKTYYLSMRVVSVKTGKITRTSIKKTDQFSNVESLTADTVEYLLGKEASGEIAKSTTADTAKKDTDTAKRENVTGGDKDSMMKKDVAVSGGNGTGGTPAITNSYLSAGVGFGVSFTLGDVNRVLGMGYTPLVLIHYNLAFDWGIIGAGLLTGSTILGTRPPALFQYDLFSCPVAASVRYKTNFAAPFFGFAEVCGGVSLLIVNFKQDYQISQEMAAKPLALVSLGGGYAFTKSLNVSVAGNASLVMMDNVLYFDVTPVLQAEYSF
jgi:hypothetical protein